MRANLATIALLALATTLPANFAFAQAAAGTADRGGQGAGVGAGAGESDASPLSVSRPEVRRATTRNIESCERRLKTVVVGNEVYFAFVDCLDRKL